MFILVVGATGVLGRRTVSLLLEAGHRVRAMTRSAERQALIPPGAETVIADLTDVASLERACNGAEAVVAAAHAFTGSGRNASNAVDGAGHCSLIDAAKRSGVRRFVYTSALASGPSHPIDFFRTKATVERYLQGSGLEFVILRPSAFMEWHVHEFNGRSMLTRGRSMLIGDGVKPRNFIAARDVARFVMFALTEPSLRNRVLDLGGPQNLTDKDVAFLYAEVAGITPRIVHVPAALAAVVGTIASLFHPGVGRVIRQASLPAEAFSEVFDPSALLEEFRVDLTSPREFVRERVDEWRHASAAP